MTPRITPFPGTIAARNALLDPKTTPEARTAAHDLLWAASCTEYRTLTDAELAEVMPFIARKADRFPPLASPEPAMATGWMALRGWEIPAIGAVLLFSAYVGVWIIDLLVQAVVALS